jgi:hypothetical protein
MAVKSIRYSSLIKDDGHFNIEKYLLFKLSVEEKIHNTLVVI